MPDASSLYPAPPQQQQQSNSLLNNPGQAIGLMQGLQNLQLQQATMPAQIARPQLENDAIVRQQQNEASEKFREYVAKELSSKGTKANRDDVFSAISNAATQYPYYHQQFPTMLKGIQQQILNERRGIPYAAGVLLGTTVTPGQAASPTELGYTPGGQTIKGPAVQFPTQAAGGGVVSQPPITAAASGQELAADRIRMGNYKQEITPWENAYKALKELGPGGTAPGAEGRVDFQAFLYGLAPSLVPDSMKKNIKNFEELRKYLAQATQAQATGLSPHTNEGLTMTATGNPNTKITEMTNEQLIRYRIGMRKYEHAQMVAAEKEGGDVGYSAAKARLANTLDPNAFGIENASPEELKRIGSLKGKERDNFNRSLRAAYEAGVVTRPGQ